MPALIALRLNASGFSVTVLGIVAAAPWLAVLLLGQRVPKLLLRHNYVPVNVAALTVTAAAVLVIIVAHHPLLIFAANFCLGVGLILRWVTCDSWIIALAPDAIRGRAIGVHETLMGCGIAAGPLIIALFGSRTAAPLFACLGLLFLATYALFRVGASQPADVPADASNAKSLRYIGLMALAAFSAGFIETSSVSFLPVLSLHAHWPVVSTLALGVFTLGGDAAAASDRIYGGRSGVSTRPADHRGIDRGLKCGVRADGPSARATAHNLVCDGRRCRSDEYARGHRGRIIGCREPDCRAASRIALAYTVGSIIGPPTVGILVAMAGPASFPFAFATIGLAFCAARLVRTQPSGVKTTLPTAVFEAGT